MRISDWSSDVCSSDLDAKTGWLRARKTDGSFRTPFDPTAINYGSDYTERNAWQYSWFVPQDQAALFRILGGDAKEIGIASCRDRVCKYVSISVDDVTSKKTQIVKCAIR